MPALGGRIIKVEIDESDKASLVDMPAIPKSSKTSLNVKSVAKKQ